jgi:hypothetical protein
VVDLSAQTLLDIAILWKEEQTVLSGAPTIFSLDGLGWDVVFWEDTTII